MAFVRFLLNGDNLPGEGCWEFHSSDHIRYQNGVDISGHNYGCNRTIRIEKNISGDMGYTVTVFNDDGIHPVWGNNIQMSPKAMKIVSRTSDKIILRGYGVDSHATMFGVSMHDASFSNYALSLNLSDDRIVSCMLHLLDRDVDLLYFE